MTVSDFAGHRFRPHWRVLWSSAREAFYVVRYRKEYYPTLNTVFVGDGYADSYKDCIEWCERNMPDEKAR